MQLTDASSCQLTSSAALPKLDLSSLVPSGISTDGKGWLRRINISCPGNTVLRPDQASSLFHSRDNPSLCVRVEKPDCLAVRVTSTAK